MGVFAAVLAMTSARSPARRHNRLAEGSRALATQAPDDADLVDAGSADLGFHHGDDLLDEKGP